MAWMAGLLVALKRAGVDLGAADLIVGTSAGAIIGTMLAGGTDLEQLAQPPAKTGGQPPERPDSATLTEVLTTLSTFGLEPGEVRRRVGALAVAQHNADGQQTQIDRRRTLIGVDTWPNRDLKIVAVNASTGEPVVWDRTSEVPLVPAVAASSAFPGASPPVRIGSEYYIDGGLRCGANADLADNCQIVVVIEPIAHLLRGAKPDDSESIQPTGPMTIVADAASIQAFGSDLYDPAAWGPSYRAGSANARLIAATLGTVWASG